VARSVLRGLRGHSISNFGFESFDLFVAAFAKEILQNCCTLILENARCDLAAVIRRYLQKAGHASSKTIVFFAFAGNRNTIQFRFYYVGGNA